MLLTSRLLDDLRESPAGEVVHLLQNEGAQVKAWEPFKPEAQMNGIHMAATLEDAIGDADTILLLVKHTEFKQLDPREIAKKTNAKVIVDTVNGWESETWKNNGFKFFRIGDNKSEA